MKFSISERTVHINITLSLSDVPSAHTEQLKYFDNLKAAVGTVLNLSLQWEIEISVIEASMERRSEQLSNLLASIVFSSALAGHGEIELLKEKLDSKAFLDGLNAMGFKASRPGLQSIQGDSRLSPSSAPSALTIGLSSAFSLAASLTMLLCIYRVFMKNKNQPNVGKVLSPKKGIAGSSNIPSQKDSEYETVESGNDYSKEYHDVLQLISRLDISVSWLIDAYLRRVVEARIEGCQEISTYDRAAALQLISAMELNDDLKDQSPDRQLLLQQRIMEGPLTEIHSRILRQICRPDQFEISIPSIKNTFDCAQVSTKKIEPIHEKGIIKESENDITSITAASQNSLQDVLLLLKSCDLDPCHLMHKESREQMEAMLTTRQEPLQAVFMAVLQLISKVEIESDVSIDPMRKRLLEKRIEEGPLSADHLRAAQSLKMLGVPEDAGSITDYPIPIAEMAREESEDTSAGVENTSKQQPVSETYSGDLVFLMQDGTVAQDSEPKSPFFKDSIYGIEIHATVQSAKERAALGLIEFKAKTANIRRSLPEWVRNGLMPPRYIPPAPPQMHSDSSNDYKHREPVQISCEVTADLGFLKAARLQELKPEASSPALAPESPSLNAKNGGAISAGEPLSVNEWQAAPIASESTVLQAGLESSAWALPSWISNAARHLSRSLRSLLGACCGCSMASWLTGRRAGAEVDQI
jgi:hypothetical protein